MIDRSLITSATLRVELRAMLRLRSTQGRTIVSRPLPAPNSPNRKRIGGGSEDEAIAGEIELSARHNHTYASYCCLISSGKILVFPEYPNTTAAVRQSVHYQQVHLLVLIARLLIMHFVE